MAKLRIPSGTLPITYDGWDEAGDFGDIQFYNVIFLEDFGPWKKDEEVSCLIRYDEKGLITDEVKSAKIQYVVTQVILGDLPEEPKPIHPIAKKVLRD